MYSFTRSCYHMQHISNRTLQSTHIHQFSVKRIPISSIIAQALQHDQGYSYCNFLARHVTTSANAADDPWVIRRKQMATSMNRLEMPPHGVVFAVDYVDTNPDGAARTVLAVPGLLAPPTALLPVMKPLHARGYRVIGVSLPGHKHTQLVDSADDRFFLYSTEEMADFLFDFIKSLHIVELDILVAHDLGALCGNMFASFSTVVKSLVSVCPLPGHIPLFGDRNNKALKLLMELYDKPILKPVIHRTILPVINRRITKLSCDNPAYLANAYRILTNQNFDVLENVGMSLEMRQIPIVSVSSRNDDIVSYARSMESVAAMSMLQDQHFDEYDDDYNLISEAQSSDGKVYKKGVVFSKGGHNPQFKTDTALPILMKEIEHVLDLVSRERVALNELPSINQFKSKLL